MNPRVAELIARAQALPPDGAGVNELVRASITLSPVLKKPVYAAIMEATGLTQKELSAKALQVLCRNGGLT